jgi:hypothetical protein
MASDHEDTRAQELEALRQRMGRPDVPWEPPTQLGLSKEHLELDLAGPPRRRSSLPRLLVGGLLLVVALVSGVVVGAVARSDDRPPAAETSATGTAAAGRAGGGPVATPACKTAVDRANVMLASAVKLRGALTEQGRILNDPANRGLPVAEVLERLAASQQFGPSEQARFDQALEAYREVVDRCDLQVP